MSGHEPLSRPAVDWSKVDWKMQNGPIASEFRVTSERVRLMRKMFGAPAASHNWRQRSTDEKLKTAKGKWDQLKGLSLAEAEKVLGFRLHFRSPVYRLIRESNLLVYQKQKRPWQKMNFDLPSQTLDRIWALPDRMASAHRYRKRLPPPKWKLPKRGSVATKLRDQYEVFVAAVEAEKNKAAQFYATT